MDNRSVVVVNDDEDACTMHFFPRVASVVIGFFTVASRFHDGVRRCATPVAIVVVVVAGRIASVRMVRAFVARARRCECVIVRSGSSDDVAWIRLYG